MTKRTVAIGVGLAAALAWAAPVLAETLDIKVRARLSTTFTDHAMQVPPLRFLKVASERQLETDLTFVRAQ